MRRNPYPWLSTTPLTDFRYGDYAALRRRYLPDDFRRDAAGHQVVATVHVEAGLGPLIVNTAAPPRMPLVMSKAVVEAADSKLAVPLTSSVLVGL